MGLERNHSDTTIVHKGKQSWVQITKKHDVFSPIQGLNYRSSYSTSCFSCEKTREIQGFLIAGAGASKLSELKQLCAETAKEAEQAQCGRISEG